MWLILVNNFRIISRIDLIKTLLLFSSRDKIKILNKYSTYFFPSLLYFMHTGTPKNNYIYILSVKPKINKSSKKAETRAFVDERKEERFL